MWLFWLYWSNPSVVPTLKREIAWKEITKKNSQWHLADTKKKIILKYIYVNNILRVLLKIQTSIIEGQKGEVHF